MKTIYLFVSMLFLATVNLFGQEKPKLEFWQDEIQRFFFIREMNAEFINNTSTTEESPLPKSQRRFNYLRFFDCRSVNIKAYDKFNKESQNVYIGKVFMSQTYFENDFNRLFDDSSKIFNNENGFFMSFKLFLSETNEIRINIYPDFNNFCNPKQHKTFFKANNEVKKYIHYKCENSEFHFGKFVEVIGEPDYEIKEFWTNEIKGNNYNKFIKCFSLDGNISGGPSLILTLLFTKFAQSNDRVTDNTYNYVSTKFPKKTPTH